MNAYDKIVARMRELDFSVARLLRESGVETSHTTMRQWVTGEKPPRFETVVKIARVLDLSLDYLADDAMTRPQDIPSRERDEMSEDERRILELTKRITAVEARFILESVVNCGLEEAKSRLLKLQPQSVAGIRNPDQSEIGGGGVAIGSEADKTVAGSKVNPNPRRK